MGSPVRVHNQDDVRTAEDIVQELIANQRALDEITIDLAVYKKPER